MYYPHWSSATCASQTLHMESISLQILSVRNTRKKEWDAVSISSVVIETIRASAREQIIWGGNYFHLPPSRGFLVWDKKQPENFSLAMCEMAWWSRDTNAKVYSRSVLGYHKEHPTQKPVELMEWCLTFAPKAKTIIDPFMGSGTTGVACAKQGRSFIGIEMDESYFNVACRRIEAAYREPDMFLEMERAAEQIGMDL